MPANKPPVSVDELAEQFFEWDGPKTPYVTLNSAKMFAEEYAKQSQPAVPSGALDCAKLILQALESGEDGGAHGIAGLIAAYAQQGDAGWQDTVPPENEEALFYVDEAESIFLDIMDKDGALLAISAMRGERIYPTLWHKLPAAPEAQQEKVDGSNRLREYGANQPISDENASITAHAETKEKRDE